MSERRWRFTDKVMAEQFEGLTAQERAEVEVFVRAVETSTSERAVWTAIMASLSRDFRREGWAEAADALDRIVATLIELLNEIDVAKKVAPPEVKQ